MRLIGFTDKGDRYIGLLQGDAIRHLGRTDDFYAHSDEVLSMAEAAPVLALSDVIEAPPVPRTARIFCVGINYLDHATEAKESTGQELPEVPMIFGRWQNSLVVRGARIPVPPNEAGLDWEAELAVIIGRTTWQTQEDDALNHVLGYTAFNDLSARRKQHDTTQFTLGKNADRSGPIGPVVVTTDELPSARGLRIQTRVNGETMQDANTSEMIHSVERIISYITDTVTLLPGDVIATGTPAGVGGAMTPQRYLHPGDEVEVEVERIGVIRNTIVDATERCG